ncbi:EamA family transporter [Roseateles saccharophilus]|uniref:Threonine/homoserine efflux transporter RhtA n=1 Tax=Roseateles saccharophilus TaxID=304 RepID=A0A4R3VKL1_ROSSA|nr:EamA family transporter [Roseateles saccharophilus]MDG0831322.1 EamA family transporter [Roseateles saccharophilus]TCV04452.1 threonine/homoserine efflux transporter RhtA [Roseateles saccharophilus]
MTRGRLLLLSALAMLAFAANSLLCRLALQQRSIDPASFATLRVAAGVVVLLLLARRRALAQPPDWPAAAMLWLYMAGFAFAYVSLSAGSGALILFASVQLTMFCAGLRAGERFAAAGWAGLALALGGLVYLVAPGLEAPPALGAALMALAGFGWGIYSLRGRGKTDALGATAGNFLRALPLCLLLSLFMWRGWQVQPRGALLALASGGITSGLGYVIWYAALPGLTAMRAATLQLSVPPLAALGGVLLLAEALTPRLLWASCAILGGIALVLLSRSKGR